MKETNFGPNFITAFLVKDTMSNEEYVSAYIIEDLKTYKEALKSVDTIFWKEAINSELDSI